MLRHKSKFYGTSQCYYTSQMLRHALNATAKIDYGVFTFLPLKLRSFTALDKSVSIVIKNKHKRRILIVM